MDSLFNQAEEDPSPLLTNDEEKELPLTYHLKMLLNFRKGSILSGSLKDPLFQKESKEEVYFKFLLILPETTSTSCEDEEQKLPWCLSSFQQTQTQDLMIHVGPQSFSFLTKQQIQHCRPFDSVNQPSDAHPVEYQFIFYYNRYFPFFESEFIYHPNFTSYEEDTSTNYQKIDLSLYFEPIHTFNLTLHGKEWNLNPIHLSFTKELEFNQDDPTRPFRIHATSKRQTPSPSFSRQLSSSSPLRNDGTFSPQHPSLFSVTQLTESLNDRCLISPPPSASSSSSSSSNSHSHSFSASAPPILPTFSLDPKSIIQAALFASTCPPIFSLPGSSIGTLKSPVTPKKSRKKAEAFESSDDSSSSDSDSESEYEQHSENSDDEESDSDSDSDGEYEAKSSLSKPKVSKKRKNTKSGSPKGKNANFGKTKGPYCSKACDWCAQKKKKCHPIIPPPGSTQKEDQKSNEPLCCSFCIETNHGPCTFNRTIMKKGRKKLNDKFRQKKKQKMDPSSSSSSSSPSSSPEVGSVRHVVQSIPPLQLSLSSTHSSL